MDSRKGFKLNFGFSDSSKSKDKDKEPKTPNSSVKDKDKEPKDGKDKEKLSKSESGRSRSSSVKKYRLVDVMEAAVELAWHGDCVAAIQYMYSCGYCSDPGTEVTSDQLALECFVYLNLSSWCQTQNHSSLADTFALRYHFAGVQRLLRYLSTDPLQSVTSILHVLNTIPGSNTGSNDPDLDHNYIHSLAFNMIYCKYFTSVLQYLSNAATTWNGDQNQRSTITEMLKLLKIILSNVDFSDESGGCCKDAAPKQCQTMAEITLPLCGLANAVFQSGNSSAHATNILKVLGKQFSFLIACQSCQHVAREYIDTAAMLTAVNRVFATSPQVRMIWMNIYRTISQKSGKADDEQDQTEQLTLNAQGLANPFPDSPKTQVKRRGAGGSGFAAAIRRPSPNPSSASGSGGYGSPGPGYMARENAFPMSPGTGAGLSSRYVPGENTDTQQSQRSTSVRSTASLVDSDPTSEYESLDSELTSTAHGILVQLDPTAAATTETTETTLEKDTSHDLTLDEVSDDDELTL